MTTPKILKVEQHGLDPVPVEERTKIWLDLFFMKAGMVMSLPTFLVGSLMVPSFSWTEILFVLVSGNLVLILLFGAMGCLGVDYGIPAYVASRFSFGYPYGAWIPSLSIVFTMIGWFAITTELAGMAVNQALGELIGIDIITPLIVLVGLMCAVPAVMGFENIKWLSIVSVPLLLGLACWMLIEILSDNPFWSLVSYTPTGETTFGTGVDWVIGALISGVFMAPDFSRYLRSRVDMYIAYFLCIFPFLFLTGIGAISKLATGDWNPINAVQQLGLGIPALIIIFFATWTTMDTALYSAGLAMTNIFTRFKRWQNTIFVSLIGTTLAVFRVTEYFRGFLLLLSNIFSPMIGILLCDYFLVRRGSISLDKAYRPEGIFHYNRGINWIAIISMIVGFLVARYTPEMYVSSLTAMGSSMLSYYFGMKLFHPDHFLRRTALRQGV